MATGTGATVCVNYDDTGLTGAQENNLQLYHLTMSGARTWTNVFTSRDTTANQICGFTKSFSTFAVLLPDGTPPDTFSKISPANAAINQSRNLTLSWTTSTGVTSYEICYDAIDNNQCDSSWISTGSVVSTAISITSAPVKYYWLVRAVNSSGITYADNNTWWTFTTKPLTTKTFNSTGAQDGWILESSEKSNKGGILNSTAATFNLGDNAQKKQYRAILSFNTAGLPDTAVITKVTLKVKKSAVIGGGNPVTTFQGFMADIKKGFFGTAALQVTDFQAAASKTYGPFVTPLSGGWYSINLTSGKAYINKLATLSGLTQFRLRFKLDDNNNAVANYINFFSGNSATNKPVLIIQYYVP